MPLSMPLLFVANTAFAVLGVFIVLEAIKKKLSLRKKLHLFLMCVLESWFMGLIALHYTPSGNEWLLRLWDALTYTAAACCTATLLQGAILYAQRYSQRPRINTFVFIPPILTVLSMATDALHGLFYANFSAVPAEIEFGPVFYINSAVYLAYTLTALVLTIIRGIRSRHKIHFAQAFILAVGIFTPFGVGMIAMLTGASELNAVATPFALLITLLLHGIAINYFDLLSIRPIVAQRVFDSISDGYAVISRGGALVSANANFCEIFGDVYASGGDVFLSDIAEMASSEYNKSMVYNLISSCENSFASQRAIAYEQVVFSQKSGRRTALQRPTTTATKTTESASQHHPKQTEWEGCERGGTSLCAVGSRRHGRDRS